MTMSRLSRILLVCVTPLATLSLSSSAWALRTEQSPRVRAGLEEDLRSAEAKPLLVFDGGKNASGLAWPLGNVQQLQWINPRVLLVLTRGVDGKNRGRFVLLGEDPGSPGVTAASQDSLLMSWPHPARALALPQGQRLKGVADFLVFSGTRSQIQLYELSASLRLSEDSVAIAKYMEMPLAMAYDSAAERVLVLSLSAVSKGHAYALNPRRVWDDLTEQLEFSRLSDPSHLAFDPVRGLVWADSWIGRTGSELIAFRWNPEGGEYERVGRGILPSGWVKGNRFEVDPMTGDLLLSNSYHGGILVLEPEMDAQKRVLGFRPDPLFIRVEGERLGGEAHLPAPIQFLPSGRIVVANENRILVLPRLREIRHSSRPPPVEAAPSPLPRPPPTVLQGPQAFDLSSSDGRVRIEVWDGPFRSARQSWLTEEQVLHLRDRRPFSPADWQGSAGAAALFESHDGPWRARPVAITGDEGKQIVVVGRPIQERVIEVSFGAPGTPEHLPARFGSREFGFDLGISGPLWVKAAEDPAGRLRLYLLRSDETFRSHHLWEGNVERVAHPKEGWQLRLAPVMSGFLDPDAGRRVGLFLWDGLPWTYRWVSGQERVEPLPSQQIPLSQAAAPPTLRRILHDPETEEAAPFRLSVESRQAMDSHGQPLLFALDDWDDKDRLRAALDQKVVGFLNLMAEMNLDLQTAMSAGLPIAFRVLRELHPPQEAADRAAEVLDWAIAVLQKERLDPTFLFRNGVPLVAHPDRRVFREGLRGLGDFAIALEREDRDFELVLERYVKPADPAQILTDLQRFTQGWTPLEDRMVFQSLLQSASAHKALQRRGWYARELRNNGMLIIARLPEDAPSQQKGVRLFLEDGLPLPANLPQGQEGFSLLRFRPGSNLLLAEGKPGEIAVWDALETPGSTVRDLTPAWMAAFRVHPEVLAQMDFRLLSSRLAEVAQQTGKVIEIYSQTLSEDGRHVILRSA